MANSHPHTYLGCSFHIQHEKASGLVWTVWHIGISHKEWTVSLSEACVPSNTVRGSGRCPRQKGRVVVRVAQWNLSCLWSISSRWEEGGIPGSENILESALNAQRRWAWSLEEIHSAPVRRPSLPRHVGPGQGRVPAFTKWPPTVPAPLSSTRAWRPWIQVFGPSRADSRPALSSSLPSRTWLPASPAARGVLVKRGCPCTQRALVTQEALAPLHLSRPHYALWAMPSPRPAGPGGLGPLCICTWIPTFVLLIQIKAHIVRNTWARSGHFSGLGWPTRRPGKGMGWGLGQGYRSAHGSCPSQEAWHQLPLSEAQLLGQPNPEADSINADGQVNCIFW